MNSPSSTGPADGLTVAAVARRLGVAPATLRTWDRRYGLGPSVHTAGAHRRYCPDDLLRLQAVRRLVLTGMSPAEAADRVQQDGHQARPGGEGPTQPGRRDEVAVRGLARAVRALDSATVVAHLRASLATVGVLPTWENLLRPVLHEIGEQWERTGTGVDAEHLVSDCASLALREWGMRHVPPLGSPVALLACTETDQHSLPLFALAAALAERQVGARVLGASVPPSALHDAVRRIGPGVVFLWSQLPGTADAASVAAVPRVRPAPVVLLGGAGWSALARFAAAEPTDSLPDAVGRIAGLLAPA